jgi:hypothetical protein
MSRFELHKEWVKEMSEFQASGQTATAWCADRGINIHRFRYWTRKLRTSQRGESTGEIRWLSVKMAEPTNEPDDTLTVVIGDVSIVVRPGFNPTFLKQVVQTLADVQ